MDFINMGIAVIPTSDDIRTRLLALNEDHFVDFKSFRIAPASLQKHFVAFANTDGGEIYVGIEDKSETGDRIKGFSSPEDANDVISVLLTMTSPSVEGVDIELLNFGMD